jgi:hypothetical protein
MSVMPIIARASFSASCGDRASLTPPPLPRPPAWICAFTTTTPVPRRLAISTASAAAKGHLAAGHGHAVTRKDRFRLVLVDFHIGRKETPDANLHLFMTQQ